MLSQSSLLFLSLSLCCHYILLLYIVQFGTQCMVHNAQCTVQKNQFAIILILIQIKANAKAIFIGIFDSALYFSQCSKYFKMISNLTDIGSKMNQLDWHNPIAKLDGIQVNETTRIKYWQIM